MIKIIRDYNSTNVKFFLVGNKAHKENERIVSEEKAIQFAKEFGIDYFIETSTRTGMNVEKLFVDAAKFLYRNYCEYKKENIENKNLSLIIQEESKDSSNCIGGKKKNKTKTK